MLPGKDGAIGIGLHVVKVTVEDEPSGPSGTV
jgi:hypothetical protein